MVFGRPPFTPDGGLLALEDAIRKEPLILPTDDPRISATIRDLIQKTLVKDPDTRVNLGELMRHPWTTMHGSEPLMPTKYVRIEATNLEAIGAVTELSKMVVVMKANSIAKGWLRKVTHISMGKKELGKLNFADDGAGQGSSSSSSSTTSCSINSSSSSSSNQKNPFGPFGGPKLPSTPVSGEHVLHKSSESRRSILPEPNDCHLRRQRRGHLDQQRTFKSVRRR